MKEYWVNVYEYPVTGEYWYGNQYSLEEAKEQQRLIAILNPDECKYRIHIKMKEPKPKYEDKFIEAGVNYHD